MILCLIIAAMAGWSTDGNNIQKAAWATASDGPDTVYIGLQSTYTPNTVPAVSLMFSDAICSSRGCNACLKAGQAVLGLLLTSFFLFLLVAVTSGVRMCQDSAMLKFLSLGLTFLVWIFSVAAFGNWNTQCYNAVNTVDGLGYTSPKYYMGYGAAVSAWVFTTIVFIMHLLTPVAEQSSAASAGAASNTNPVSDGPAKV